MPDPSQFLAGFGLIVGHEFGGYKLTEAHATHYAVRKYHEYQYDIFLTFEKIGSTNLNELVLSLNIVSRDSRYILATRNYYTCTIETPKISDFISDNKGGYSAHLHGHSVR